MPLKLILAAFLVVHGLIHAGFLSPRPPATAGGPAWPFALDRSWLMTPIGVPPEHARLMGVALVVVTLAAYTIAGAALVGLIPSGLWPATIGLGSVASIALLGLYFHPWLVLGIVIDVALLVVVVFGNWSPTAP